MARIRSPNYPQIPLSDAIALVGKIHEQEAQNFAPRDVIAKLLGYSGVNGASEKKTGAISAYGLLRKGDDRELGVSDLAMAILFPQDEVEKQQAITKAAYNPPLFKEIKEKWPSDEPSDENLKSYLIRRGFNQNSVDQVIGCYKLTMSLVSVESDMIDSSDEIKSDDRDEKTMEQDYIGKKQAPPPSIAPVGKPIMFDMETVSGTYSFDNADELQEFIEKLQKIKGLMPTKH